VLLRQRSAVFVILLNNLLRNWTVRGVADDLSGGHWSHFSRFETRKTNMYKFLHVTFKRGIG
jgi:hypothetical protein